MIKNTILKTLRLLNLASFAILLLAKPSQAEYTINLSSSLDKSDLSENCKQVFFHVIADIDSKEPQKIRGYLDGNRQNLELSIILAKDNIMTSPQLQTYWSNLIYQNCSVINKVIFGKYRTDWSVNYVKKNGRMIAAFKDAPNVLGLDYKEARRTIIAEGWKPVYAKNNEMYGGYVDFVSAEYPEVYDCAGTGLVPCIFFFNNPDDNYYLKVTTAGQFDDNYSGGKITFVEVRSSMGGAEYETHFLYH